MCSSIKFSCSEILCRTKFTGKHPWSDWACLNESRSAYCDVLSADAALFVYPASQELLEKFMGGNVSLDEFLDSFQSSRKTYHIRRAQAEKMQELAQAGKQQEKTKRAEECKAPEVKDSEKLQEPQRPNGFLAQGPLRVFQVRYGLTPAILLPHYPVSPPASAPCLQSSAPTAEPQLGQAHILSPSAPLPGHGHAVGLRVIGQLSGGWPANGRPVRVQQLYRPNPQQPEPPYR